MGTPTTTPTPSSKLLPNTTQTPDVILDQWMGVLSGAEFKVVMYVCRRTFGFRMGEGDAAAVTLAQFVGGTTSTKTGEHLDHGTGLNKDTVVAALDALEAAGVLVRERQRGKAASHYRLNLGAPCPTVEGMVACRKIRQEETAPTPLVGKSDKRTKPAGSTKDVGKSDKQNRRPMSDFPTSTHVGFSDKPMSDFPTSSGFPPTGGNPSGHPGRDTQAPPAEEQRTREAGASSPPPPASCPKGSTQQQQPEQEPAAPPEASKPKTPLDSWIVHFERRKNRLPTIPNKGVAAQKANELVRSVGKETYLAAVRYFFADGPDADPYFRRQGYPWSLFVRQFETIVAYVEQAGEDPVITAADEFSPPVGTGRPRASPPGPGGSSGSGGSSSRGRRHPTTPGGRFLSAAEQRIAEGEEENRQYVDNLRRQASEIVAQKRIGG